jgi:hypothetical protein
VGHDNVLEYSSEQKVASKIGKPKVSYRHPRNKWGGNNGSDDDDDDDECFCCIDAGRRFVV